MSRKAQLAATSCGPRETNVARPGSKRTAGARFEHCSQQRCSQQRARYCALAKRSGHGNECGVSTEYFDCLGCYKLSYWIYFVARAFLLFFFFPEGGGRVLTQTEERGAYNVPGVNVNSRKRSVSSSEHSETLFPTSTRRSDRKYFHSLHSTCMRNKYLLR